ncbi:MAG: sterol desaturase family protein, partial [Hyphomicrobiaceae bacterium]|nr:sterol desaturase family protein [Hyphomicrobiaceae bacterium]
PKTDGERRGHQTNNHYDFRETAASLGVAVGDVVSRAALSGLVAIPFLAVYQVRLFDIPLDHPLSWIALFLGVEFFYYWFHRASHRVRWLWATHAVHHSATRFNLSAAVRLGWTGQLSGAFVFFLPLAWIGFHPLAIGAVIAASLLYQFFLHTSLDVSLGPLEWVLNTPRHHRVHHASNETCLDRNYGSVLIIWDRLFGTFAEAPQVEPLRYGLKGVAPTNNVFAIAFGEWCRMWRDVRRAGTWRERWRVLAGPPG